MLASRRLHAEGKCEADEDVRGEECCCSSAPLLGKGAASFSVERGANVGVSIMFSSSFASAVVAAEWAEQKSASEAVDFCAVATYPNLALWSQRARSRRRCSLMACSQKHRNTELRAQALLGGSGVEVRYGPANGGHGQTAGVKRRGGLLAAPLDVPRRAYEPVYQSSVALWPRSGPGGFDGHAMTLLQPRSICRSLLLS